jgi:hypothetical protein
LHVNGLAAGEQWSVYTLAGVLVAEGTKAQRHESAKAASMKLPQKGIYIVKQGNRAVKVIF